MVMKYKLVACMATMPSRAHTAPIAIRSLVNQFDEFYLVLNNFKEVPEWAIVSGVIPILPRTSLDYGAAGKLLALSFLNQVDDTIFYCVDDDVLYPEDFARQLATFLSRNKKSVVGIHGSVILPCFKSWRQDRKIYCARKRLLIKK